MSRKWRRIAQGQPEPVPARDRDALRKRRNRRFLVLGLIALSFPILEVIAYRFRAITLIVENRTKRPDQGFEGQLSRRPLRGGRTQARSRDRPRDPPRLHLPGGRVLDLPPDHPFRHRRRRSLPPDGPRRGPRLLGHRALHHRGRPPPTTTSSSSTSPPRLPPGGDPRVIGSAGDGVIEGPLTRGVGPAGTSSGRWDVGIVYHPEAPSRKLSQLRAKRSRLMLRTLEAVIDAEGVIRLLEPTPLPPNRKVLVTILNEAARPWPGDTALMSEAALSDWNHPDEDEAWAYFQTDPAPPV